MQSAQAATGALSTIGGRRVRPSAPAQAARERAARVDDAVALEPGARVRGVALEPGARRAEAEAVAPGIHVGEHACAADGGQLTREQHLQVAHRRLLEVVAACVRVEPGAALRA